MDRILKFIKEARKRGFDDIKIEESLKKAGWPMSKIQESFCRLNNKTYKHKLELYIDAEIIKLLEKRAKQNIMTLAEQIEDILRRSTLRQKGAKVVEKIDDLLVSIFSRKKTNKK